MQTQTAPALQEVRCRRCGRLLLRARRAVGEIKCPRCGELNQLAVAAETNE